MLKAGMAAYHQFHVLALTKSVLSANEEEFAAFLETVLHTESKDCLECNAFVPVSFGLPDRPKQSRIASSLKRHTRHYSDCERILVCHHWGTSARLMRSGSTCRNRFVGVLLIDYGEAEFLMSDIHCCRSAQV